MKQEFWSELRKNDFLVVDAPARKIAVYPNRDGMVVIAISDNGKDCTTELQLSEVRGFLSRLAVAEHFAGLIKKKMDAEYGAHLAVEKARS